MSRLGFGSLQTKLLLGTVLLLCLVMGAVTAVVEHRQRKAIVHEMQRRGEVLARSLAAISTGPLLLYNFTALEQNVARVASDADVMYAMVLDAEGRVAAHNRRPDWIGQPLEGPARARATSAMELVVQEVPRRSGELIYEIAVPMFVEGHRWGTVVVGLSKRRTEAQIKRTRWELGGLTVAVFALGGLGAAFVARRIARPVRLLAAGAEAIARGELEQRIAPAGADEIGQLAVSFNHMAAQLLHQRGELEAAHAELSHRFMEVAELKSYTDSILGSITSGIVTLDLDGRVATLNPAAEMLSGLFEPEVAGRYCQEVFAHSPDVGEMLMETLASRSAAANVSLTLRRPNGTTLPIEMSTAPLRGHEGKDLGVVGVFRDVTVLRELEDELRRSDRLAALGTLAAGLAHEIKNPLTSVLTFTRFMPRKFDDEHFRERFLRVVPHELERIDAIVERLLELARPARLTFSPVRLSELLDRAVDLYAHRIESQEIEVRREYARDAPAVLADPELLYQALVNLVTNALDALPEGGRLTVRLGASSGDDPAPGGWGRGAPGRRIRVEIEDTGRGIAPADADKVFNPFFTTKSSGTGLGLALTHKIITDHRGLITFRSTLGSGTTFRVVLPLAPPFDDVAGAGDDGEMRTAR